MLLLVAASLGPDPLGPYPRSLPALGFLLLVPHPLTRTPRSAPSDAFPCAWARICHPSSPPWTGSPPLPRWMALGLRNRWERGRGRVEGGREQSVERANPSTARPRGCRALTEPPREGQAKASASGGVGTEGPRSLGRRRRCRGSDGLEGLGGGRPPARRNPSFGSDLFRGVFVDSWQSADSWKYGYRVPSAWYPYRYEL